MVLSLLLSLAPVAAAQSGVYPMADRQLWEFGLWGAEAMGKVDGEAFGVTHISMAGLHAGRVIYEARSAEGTMRALEYVVEVQPLFLVTRRQSTYGGGLSPLGLKWNFAPRGRYRPYIEFNGGAMFTQKNVPPGRTSSFNFTIDVGPGVMIALPRNQALSVRLQYWHLSNADMGHANPQFNTIELVVGYHWLKAKPASARQVSGAASASE
jgi:hypothetical protein